MSQEQTALPHEVLCPLCDELVVQRASATLSLALWQHVNWKCAKRPLASAGGAQETLREIVQKQIEWLKRQCYGVDVQKKFDTNNPVTETVVSYSDAMHALLFVREAFAATPPVPAERTETIPQVDLPEDAAKVLRENLWDLYGGEAEAATLRAQIRELQFQSGDNEPTKLNIALETAYNAAIKDVLALIPTEDA